VERAVEVGDAPERTRLHPLAEEDLVGGAPVPRGVRSVAVVPLEEVGAEAVELADAGEEPEAGEDGLLEGAEDPLDPPVGPGVRREGELVPHASGGEEVGHRRGAEDRAPIGVDPLRWTVLLDHDGEDAGDLHARGPG